MSYRFLFFRLNGDGTETFIKGDVPLSNTQPARKLSAPHQIRGTLTRSVTDLVDTDGSPLIRRWQTTAYVADENDRIWCGGVVADFTIDGASLTLDVAGMTAYLKGMPFDGDVTKVDEDPLNIVRLFWNHAQSQPGGDLGLVVEDTTSSVRIGNPPRQVEFSTTDGSDVSFSASDEALHYNWWETADMGGVIDQLARDTPFDYVEEHAWDGETISHTLRLGYPSIGAVRPDRRFVLGENVRVIPSEDYSGDDVVTDLWLFGAGEGRTRIRGVARLHPENSVRRVKTINDKRVDNQTWADARAAEELRKRQPDVPGAGVTSLLVSNHPNTPFGSFDVGDVVPYSGAHHWGDVLIWVKIISMTLLPSGQMQVDVVRADTLAG